MYDRTLILAAVDLPTLADELLGPGKRTGRAATWRCPNPDHQQTGRTPPVTVHTTHRGERRWRCHACGDGGTAIDLVLRTHNTDTRGALEFLAHRTGITTELDELRPRPQPPRAYEPPPPQPATGGLRRYVDECAHRLWTSSGREVRDWLTITRGLPADVLEHNHVGADFGPRQGRPWGLAIPAGRGAAVFPARDHGDLVYVQLRLLDPEPDQHRWLNPTHRLAPHPRIALYQPTTQRHPDTIIVTEGAIDGLSAAAGGYTAAAVLGAGLVHNPVTATLIARIPGHLVLAFDADNAGDQASERLPVLLAAHGRTAGVVTLDGGDLNDYHLAAGPERWPGLLANHVEHTAIVTREALCR